MTNCTGATAEQCLESYLVGTLSEVETERFEEHYFDCPICLAQLQALQAVQEKLRSEPRKVVKALIPWPIRMGAMGAIAAMLALTFMVFHARRMAQQPDLATSPATVPSQPGPAAPKPPTAASAAVSRLADLALPAFQVSNLRGESGDPHYSAGMKAYGRQDCPAAEKALAQVPAEDQEALAARFLSGVCLMHEGNLTSAAQSLRGVADAGDSAQQEAALYYLAQIALAGSDATTARHYLARTISLHGDFEQRARTQLTHVREDDGSR